MRFVSLRFVSNHVSLRALWSQDETIHIELIRALGMTKGAASKVILARKKKGWPTATPANSA
jgi:DNA-binding MarR family transcriptional regulator